MKNRPIVRYENVLGGPRPPLSGRGLKILAITFAVAILLALVVVATNSSGIHGGAVLGASLVTFIGGFLALWRDVMLRVHARLHRSTLADRTRIGLFLAILWGIGLVWIALILAVISIFGRP